VLAERDSASRVTGSFPLSAQQRRLWLLGPEPERYRARCVWEIAGPLDSGRLREALQAVVDRHEILRTVFRFRSGLKVPFQAVLGFLEPAWEELDEPPAGVTEGAAGLLRRQDAVRLDLEQGPLLSASLLRLGEERHLLALALPSLCADAKSLENLGREILSAYTDLGRGREPGGGELLPYADFSAWQEDLRRGDDEEARNARELWLGQGSAALPGLSREPGSPPAGLERHAFALSPELAGAVARLAESLGSPLEAVLLAAWGVVLWRLTGESEPTVGQVFAGRKYEEFQDALGPYCRCLPLRVAMRRELRFGNLVQRLRDAQEAAAESQEYAPFDEPPVPGGRLVELPAGFRFEEVPAPFAAAALSWSLLSRQAGLEPFCLEISWERRGGSLQAELAYDPGLFDGPAARRLEERCLALLAAAVVDPRAAVGDLPAVGPEERRYLLTELNDTRRELPDHGAIHHRFEEQARLRPEAPALVCGESRMTFAELDRAAGRLARHLRRLGAGAEDRIALFLERSADLVVALLAVLKAGGAYVPLDASFPRDRLAIMLEEAGARLVITQRSLAGVLPADAARPVLVDEVPENDAGDEALPAVLDGARLAYVLFTSGSTGRPKGVAIEHRQLLNYVQAVGRRMDLTPGGTYATVSTFAADLGNTMVFGALCLGGCLHVVPQEVASDPEAFGSAMRSQAIDCLKIVPSHLRALLLSDHPQDLLPRRLLVLGGEVSPWPLIEQVNGLAPGCRVLNHYGPTETTIGVMTLEVTGGSAGAPSASVPIGRPLDNCRFYLVDEGLQLLPAGRPGELLIGGAGLARGYLGRPDLTAERFVPSPFGLAGERLYRTGDLARLLADGTVEFLGRVDHQVKIRGFRIELREIEAVLHRHPDVWDAVVMAREDVAHEKRLVGYAVPRRGRELSAPALRAFLAAALPDYMVPAVVVLLDTLPLNANGKVDRAALPAPERAETAGSGETAGPRTDVERTLAEIWREVLSLPRIGIHDNFFELGGDSILVIQAVARANRAGLLFNPKQMFEHQTIAELAAVAGTAARVEAEQGTVTGEVPLTPIQLWFFEQGFAEPHHWNQSVLLEVPDTLDAARLATAARLLTAHHDALRLRFAQEAAGWRGWIASEDGGALTSVDLSALPPVERGRRIGAALEQVQASLDLARGPIARFVFFPFGAGEPGRLLIAIHHLAVDGVSWRVLLEDLRSIGDRLLRGEPVALPPKTSSLAAWAVRLRDHAAPLEPAELPYWQAAVSAAAPRLPREAIIAGGANTAGSARQVLVSVEPEETRALLQELPARYGVQINEVLLTALARGLARWTGAPDVLVDLEGHGREPLFDDLDMSRTVGWFTTHFPLLLTAGEDRPAGEVLRSVKDRLRRIPGRGIGYGLLRYLGSSGALRGLPEPEVKFNYLGQLDGTVTRAGLFAPAREGVGPDRAPAGHRSHLLDVNGSVIGGRLHLNWTYSANLHRRESIQELAEAVAGELRALAALRPEREEEGYSPADFPLARLDQARLERLLAAVPAGGITDEQELPGRRIEDVYPVSPLQESLLYHTLAAPGSGVGFEQKAALLEGGLDLDAFRRTWQAVVDRHPILRTAFFADGEGVPLQVVLRRAVLPVEVLDWQELPEAERRERFGALLAAERQRGFDPARAPLMRVSIVRVSAEAFQLVWSYHHLLLDAWCRNLVLREVFALYDLFRQGRLPDPPEGRPYRDYIAWLAGRDRAAAEAFWRRSLAGFSSPTPLPAVRPAGAEALSRAGEKPYRLLRLEPALNEGLEVLARRHKLTLNTLVQGAWALLLARWSGVDDVVFGATVSGRPPELPGAEWMLGMFINNLPVRVRVPLQAGLIPWLRELQDTLVDLREYEWTSPLQVQELSELLPGRRLFESLLIFQNYPVEDGAQSKGGGSLRVADVRSRLETNYPLTVVVGPLEPLTLRLYYDPVRFDDNAADRLARGLEALLGGLAMAAEAGDRRLAEVPLLDEAERQRLLAAGRTIQEAVGDLSGAPAVHPAWSRLVAAGWRIGPGFSTLYGPRGGEAHLLSPGLELLPVGAVGELCVGGGVEPGAGLRTGGLARRLEDGHIELCGHLERGWAVDGERVDLAAAEIEAMRHPGVREAVATTWEDALGDTQVVLYFATGGDPLPTVDELDDHLAARLPRHAIPFLYVRCERLPVGADGIVDLGALPPPDRAGAALERPYVAPFDALELRLQRIWESVFGVRPIRLDDDFFELGGHSLLAVRLTGDVRRELGVSLPLAVLLQGGATIRKMAEVLRREGGAAPWSPLVEIQTGDGRARSPLFCVHAMGGEVLSYLDLARSLGTDQPVYGLQAYSWAGGEAPGTLEEMAAAYLAEVRRVQPRGPYRLVGWSFGGIVALEMAQQLLAAGEAVSLLGILDTNLDTRESSADTAEVILRFKQRGSTLTVDELRQIEGVDRQLAYAIERGALPRGLDAATAERYARAGEANSRAKVTYVPRVYPGPVTLFRAADGHVTRNTDPTLGWEHIAQGGLEIIDVPGGHNTLVERPYVQELARRLRESLERSHIGG